MAEAEAPLPTRAPFHLEATVRVLQRRPSNLVDRWDQGRYVRVLREGTVTVENRGTIDAPDVWCTGEHAPVIRRILGLDLDPEPLRAIAESDPALLPLARALRGLRPPRYPDLFEAFANVIPFQQVSVDAGVACVTRLIERFGDGAFPTAQTIADASVSALRACGTTTRKAEALADIARRIASGELTEAALLAKRTPEALRTLTALPGIGPWSAALVLIRGLGRLDVFPPGDVGIRRLLGTVAHEHGYVYFLATGSALLAKGLITPYDTPTPTPARRPSPSTPS